MRQVYADDLLTLFHGDARSMLEGDLAAIAPAVIVCDPPYGIDYRSGHVDPSKSSAAIVGDDDQDLRGWLLRWARARNLPVACFGTWKRPAPFRARARLVWDKGPCAGMGDLTLPWKDSTEEIFILGPGWSGQRGESVLRIPTPHAGSIRHYHPHEKPVALLLEILRKAPPGLVLDPCCGSGSTLLAARELGRQAIGIEIDARWARVAHSRVAQGSLFSVRAAAPVWA